MSNSPGAISLIAAAALSILSCRSAGVPEPLHAGEQARKEVCMYSVPLANARKTMAASLEKECRRYCTYISGGIRELPSGTDGGVATVFSALDLLNKALNYGPKVKGRVLFCDYVQEEANPESSSARALFRIGVENASGWTYTIKRRVAFSFKYAPNESASATGVNIIRLIPVWSSHPDYQFGIVSQEKEAGVSRAPRKKRKSAPKERKPGPTEGLQEPPKKFLRRNHPSRRVPENQLRRCARR
ncbi:hypothetical protein JW721_05605 [Candidatus Micrarchaeota archaeon]|nr:hypothetical protein [Candidatus Micrarchaeota archaeon]